MGRSRADTCAYARQEGLAECRSSVTATRCGCSGASRMWPIPGQGPRDVPAIASLWWILDLAPSGRGNDADLH
jgi:hypothetical protein